MSLRRMAFFIYAKNKMLSFNKTHLIKISNKFILIFIYNKNESQLEIHIFFYLKSYCHIIKWLNTMFFIFFQTFKKPLQTNFLYKVSSKVLQFELIINLYYFVFLTITVQLETIYENNYF